MITLDKNLTILVTGSAGFIGFHSSKILLEQGLTIIGLDNLNNYYDPQLKKDRNKILREYPNYKFYKGDLKDLAFIKTIFKENCFAKLQKTYI